MKNVFMIFFILSLPLVSFAQDSSDSDEYVSTGTVYLLIGLSNIAEEHPETMMKCYEENKISTYDIIECQKDIIKQTFERICTFESDLKSLREALQTSKYDEDVHFLDLYTQHSKEKIISSSSALIKTTDELIYDSNKEEAEIYYYAKQDIFNPKVDPCSSYYH